MRLRNQPGFELGKDLDESRDGRDAPRWRRRLRDRGQCDECRDGENGKARDHLHFDFTSAKTFGRCIASADAPPERLLRKDDQKLIAQ
jgi:hypothetical protein